MNLTKRWAVLNPTISSCRFKAHSESMRFVVSEIQYVKSQYSGLYSSEHCYLHANNLRFSCKLEDLYEDFFLFRYKAVATRKLEEISRFKCML